MNRNNIFIGIGIVVLGIVLIWSFWPRHLQAPINSDAQITSNATVVETPLSTQPPVSDVFKTVYSSDVPNVDKAFSFSVDIPLTWQVEAVPASQSISFYDPQSGEESTLERSQIFIRHFTARDFLTLSTVTIYSKESLIIGSRPAVRYDIEKKSSAPVFSSQPAWRNERHIVTDIRVSDSNPSVFYVIAKRPDMDSDVYESFLESINL